MATFPISLFSIRGKKTLVNKWLLVALVIVCTTIGMHANASAQSLTIYGDRVPLNPIDDGLAITIGTKFWSAQAGVITGIRFYRAVANPNGYVARLYSAGGTRLGSANLAHENGPVPGWQTVNFANPIPISANTTYITAYYSSIGRGAWDEYGMTQGVTSGPLTAPASAAAGGNGVYRYGNGFPNQVYHASNYYVDVLFTSNERSLLLSFNPPNPSIANSAASGTVVASIVPRWTDGSPFTGTLAFGQPYSNDQGRFAISGTDLIIDPAGPGVSGDAGTTQNVTVTATQ